MRAVVAVVALFLLAGCADQGPEPTQRTTTTTTAPAPTWVDGAAAHAYVAYLAGELAEERVPGHADHGTVPAWLAQQIAPGWQITWQNFTGRQYAEAPKGSVERYAKPPACSQEDHDRVGNLTFHNLVATYGKSGPLFLLGAHWDAKEEANQDADPEARTEVVPGANDGASGIGVLLQLTHHVAAGEVQLPYRVGVAFFDGEDGFEDCHPLAGSILYARENADQVDRFLLLDMVGDPDARFPRERSSTKSDPDLVDVLWEHGQRRLPDNFIEEQRSVIDDHIPFIEQGVPAVDLIDYGRDTRHGFPPYWHTTGDTIDNIDAQMLGAVGDVVVASMTDERIIAWSLDR